MKGTVEPSSRRSTAALTWAGLTESSEAICAMISIRLYCLLTSESRHFPDMARAFKQYFGCARCHGSALCIGFRNMQAGEKAVLGYWLPEHAVNPSLGARLRPSMAA